MDAIVQQDGSLERLLTELEFDIHGLVEYRISTGWRVSLPTIGLCGICYVSGSPCRMIVGASPQCCFLRILLQLSHPGSLCCSKGRAGDRCVPEVCASRKWPDRTQQVSAEPSLLGTTIIRLMSFTFPSEHIGAPHASSSVTYNRQLLKNLAGTTLYVKPSTKSWRNTGGLNLVLK